MTVSLIFRKRLKEYNSIEEVFERVKPFFEGRLEYSETVLPSSSASLTGILKNIRTAAGVKAEVYHITGDAHYVSLGFPGRRTILTIHDFYSARRGSRVNRLVIRILWFWLPAWKVRYITVISEWSRQEVLKVIPFARKKIRVIPNPVIIPGGPFLKKFDPQEPAILLVGTKPNKNLEGMVEACRGLNCRLMILGKLSDEQQELIGSTGIEYENFVNVSYAQVIGLYQECDLLLYASFEEGFGLPILEAQAVGRPVITSNVAAMPDTAGKGACLVDPYEVGSIREGVEKVIGDGKYREELVANGIENLKRFNPEKIAGMYMELYEEVVHLRQGKV